MTSKQQAGSIAQDQFLKVLSRDDAIATFRKALKPTTLGTERVALGRVLGRVLAEDVTAPVDAPPFDRSVVDGFAVSAGDLANASAGAPATLTLTGEIVSCGRAPTKAVAPGRATPIATGAPIPRGADAVVMIEHTEPDGDDQIVVMRSVGPGQNIAFAGSDIARGQTLLRGGTVVGAREIAMFAAVGCADATVWRKPRIGVLSTGDELVQPGEPLAPAKIYDSNAPVIAAALEENGCEAVRFEALPDDETRLSAGIQQAFKTCDALILSGGTSKGAGDLTYRIIDRLGRPGIVVHGVALKPGKPLCLAVCDGKPVVVLPGFPTSAMFTFHDIVAPVLRILAGLPERAERNLTARIPMRIASELGRTEFVMMALAASEDGFVAHPVGKGSGAVTAFSQADGFVAVDSLADSVSAGATMTVQLFSTQLRAPDLVIMGSHCVGLDSVVGELSRQRLSARVLALGSLGGLNALQRGECDIAPIHLLDPKSGAYNRPFLSHGMRLVSGWQRMQGFVFRRGDTRFEGKDLAASVATALGNKDCFMVNRNQGAGTRTLIDDLLKGERPPGYWNQPRSHNAVVAAIAQERADWGIAIKPVADALGLGFIPVAAEHYDFAVQERSRNMAAIAAFEEALSRSQQALRDLGFEPS
ncbi:MAG: molybdopterin biosynthesis protein [Hyphomicrobiaceae bacterium]